MKDLIIITPCSRPENLEKMYISMCQDIPLNLIWLIIRDSESEDTFYMFSNPEFTIGHGSVKGGVAGKLQINYALDELASNIHSSGWIYVLDDDNLMHPEFLKTISAAIDDNPNARAFIFSQELPDGTIRKGDEIKVCHIDQAQYCIHTDLIGDNRFVQQYEADGIFIEEIYKQHPEKFVVLPQVISYYNKLR